MMPDARHRKSALRAELRERRHTLTSSERQHAFTGITHNLQTITTTLNARSVACYLSTPFEPSTREYLQWAFTENIRVLFPVSRDDGLLDWTTGNGTEIEGPCGRPTIHGTLLGPIAANDVDLIIAPAAAIDHTGMRLGWGRGYFDKTIGSMKKCPPVYAVVFDSEILDTLPHEKHDQTVHGAVTPTRILTFAPPSA